MNESDQKVVSRRDPIADLLRSYGLSLAEQITLEEETGGKRALGGFAVAMAS